MKLNKIVACICEGHAEHAIIDILYENKILCFEELLEDKPIMCRAAKEFEKRYLNKCFENTIDVLRILDSRNEKFALSAIYRSKVNVINVVTSAEIEVLIIFAENKYEDYLKQKKKNKQLKPSQYCKQVLGYKSVKTYEFVRKYFENSEKLVEAINKYVAIKKISNREISLYDIMKPEYQKLKKKP